MAIRQSADFGRTQRSVSAATGTGEGDDFAIASPGRVDIGWNIIVGGTGAWSALTVLLEGSIDGTNWTTLDTSTSTSTVGERDVVAVTPQYIRANVSVATVSSGTPTVSVDILVRRSA